MGNLFAMQGDPGFIPGQEDPGEGMANLRGGELHGQRRLWLQSMGSCESLYMITEQLTLSLTTFKLFNLCLSRERSLMKLTQDL